jgi:hypothetical protein
VAPIIPPPQTAVVLDVAVVVDLDVGPKFVGEAETISGPQFLDRRAGVGAECVGRRRVVVGKLHAGGDLPHRALPQSSSPGH